MPELSCLVSLFSRGNGDYVRVVYKEGGKVIVAGSAAAFVVSILLKLLLMILSLQLLLLEFLELLCSFLCICCPISRFF